DETRQEYAHAAVAFILSPDGIISRYLYGLTFKANDLKLAILEASEGKIGNTIDRILLYCYHYDPDAKGYVVFASNIMKLGGLLSLILLFLFLAILWLKDRRRSSLQKRDDILRARAGRS
ncbi:MAG: SCO family protein, partial [Candidatus Zixiibacteriota bacterium]